MFKVDIDWIGYLFRIRPHDHHFPRMKEQRIAKAPVARDSQAAFKHEHFDVLIRDVFHHDGCPGDCSGHSRSVNLGAAESFRDLEKHRTLFQGQVASPGFETEERFCADPGQSVILKQQLGT
jgi:hypothetical protein